mgnify:CR=1 FL=1
MSAVLVRVIAIAGSTPREPGAAMRVDARRVEGTIGGGALEWRAIQEAKAMLATGEAARELDLALGPELGQCCGGRVRLRLEATDQPFAEPLPEDALDLVLFGAGHVGRALVQVLAVQPCRIRWIDPRAELLPEAPRANLTPIPSALPVHEVARGPKRAAWLVMTHSHDLDLDLCEAILRRGDARFLGLIGSSTKRARFETRLLARGIAPDALRRLTCPIGLAGIAGKHPGTIAIATAAQLLALPR